MTFPCREWLIAALTGRPLPAFTAGAAALVEAAGNEGVLLLLEQAMAAHPDAEDIPIAVRVAVQAAAKSELFGQLDMLREQQQVFAALAQAGIPFLVLKGGALAHWLYAKTHLRLVTDLDILLPNQDALQPLAEALKCHGYALAPVAGDRVGREHPLFKAGGPYGQYTVDAHWALLNSTILSNAFDYSELATTAKELPGCAGAYGLSPVHALCNAAGHRALNLPYTYVQGIQNARSLRWLWDIHLLAMVLTPAEWRALDTLARAKGLCGVLADALGAAAEELCSPVPDDLLSDWHRLGRSEHVRMIWFKSWPRFQWQQFLASDIQWRGRMSWLGQRLWPDAEAMRERYGEASEPGWRVLFRRLGIGLKRFFGG